MSLAALGFGPGDEAIVPTFTWISTANVVEHLGGKVVFADIDLSTFNLNVDVIESLITPRTKVIIPVIYLVWQQKWIPSTRLPIVMGFGLLKTLPVVLCEVHG